MTEEQAQVTGNEVEEQVVEQEVSQEAKQQEQTVDSVTESIVADSSKPAVGAPVETEQTVKAESGITDKQAIAEAKKFMLNLPNIGQYELDEKQAAHVADLIDLGRAIDAARRGDKEAQSFLYGVLNQVPLQKPEQVSEVEQLRRQVNAMQRQQRVSYYNGLAANLEKKAASIDSELFPAGVPDGVSDLLNDILHKAAGKFKSVGMDGVLAEYRNRAAVLANLGKSAVSNFVKEKVKQSKSGLQPTGGAVPTTSVKQAKTLDEATESAIAQLNEINKER